MRITGQQRKNVRQRAGFCCEYCRLPEIGGTITFHIDHVIPKQHGGLDKVDNLCLACYQCNGFKGPNLAGIDPVTGKIAPLYNPREDRWDEHFQLMLDATLVGQTPEGRTTVRLLRLNEARRVERRQLLIEDGLYPCLPDEYHSET